LGDLSICRLVCVPRIEPGPRDLEKAGARQRIIIIGIILLLKYRAVF